MDFFFRYYQSHKPLGLRCSRDFSHVSVTYPRLIILYIPVWECTIHCWAAATPLSTYSKRKSCESTLSTYIPWMASFIIMSVQSQTFNILKDQVWLFLHFFSAILWPPVTWTSFARIEMAFLVPWSWTNFWQTWPHVWCWNVPGVRQGKPSFYASDFGHCSLVLFVPKIYSPFAAGGVCKKFLPLNLSVFCQRRYWTLFRYFHSWSTGGWLQFSDLGHRSNGSIHEFYVVVCDVATI